MRYRITRHPLVRDDLSAITSLIGDYAGYAVARRKVLELQRAMANLLDYPHVGTVRSDIYPGLRAIPAAEKAVICFTVDDETLTVFIIAVTYAGADWQARVAERR